MIHEVALKAVEHVVKEGAKAVKKEVEKEAKKAIRKELDEFNDFENVPNLEGLSGKAKSLPEKLSSFERPQKLPQKLDHIPRELKKAIGENTPKNTEIQKPERYLDKKSVPTETKQNTECKEQTDNAEKKTEMPTLQVAFRCIDADSFKEFSRQLRGQERGLNSMSVQQWIENRQHFKENGRTLEGAEAQKIMRQKALQSRIESNQKKGMTYAEARQEASEWIKGQAALHNPDQIAGGDPNKVSRMGDAKVNSSIGSQWRTRIDSLEESVMEFAKNYSEEELSQIKMNVRLSVEV